MSQKYNEIKKDQIGIFKIYTFSRKLRGGLWVQERELLTFRIVCL